MVVTGDVGVVGIKNAVVYYMHIKLPIQNWENRNGARGMKELTYALRF